MSAILQSRAAVALISAAATAGLSYWVPINSDLSKAQAVSLHRSQSLTLWMQAQMGEELYQTADISQRLSHYTDSHHPDEEVLMCPECTEGKPRAGSAPPVFMRPTGAIDLVSDFSADAREIRANASSQYLQAKTQRATISHTLQRLRAQKGRP